MHAMDFFATLNQAFNLDSRNRCLSNKDVANMRSGSSRCSILKITALVGVISSIAFALFAIIAFDMLAMSFVLVGTGLVGVLCYDAFVVAGKMQAVFNRAEMDVRLSPADCAKNSYTRMNYLTEGTLLARPIGQLSLRNSPLLSRP